MNNMNNIILSAWTTIDEYCATRFVFRSDINDCDNRVAFIEKTPRYFDGCDWIQGPKGTGGNNPEMNCHYGFNKESRDWCDKQLKKMGYKFIEEIDRPSATEMLDLIKRLPNSKDHIHICPFDGAHCVTNEFFAGSFAGRAFEADNYEDAAEQLIDYMYQHLNHDSMVGKIVTESGFPNLDKLYEFCKFDEDEE